MANEDKPYNYTGGIVTGILMIICGLAAIAIEIPLAAEQIDMIYIGVGFWAGSYYIIVGIVTLLAGLRRHQPCLIRASFTLLGGGLWVGIVALGAALVALTCFVPHSYSGDMEVEAFEHDTTVATTSLSGQMALSGVMEILMIAASLLDCKCGACHCCRQEVDRTEDEKARVVWTKEEIIQHV